MTRTSPPEPAIGVQVHGFSGGEAQGRIVRLVMRLSGSNSKEKVRVTRLPGKAPAMAAVAAQEAVAGFVGAHGVRHQGDLGPPGPDGVDAVVLLAFVLDRGVVGELG